MSIVRTTKVKKEKENINGGTETWVSSGMQELLLPTPVFYLQSAWSRAPVGIEKMLISIKINNLRGGD